MSSSTVSLGPRSLGEILDRTAQLYRRNFLLFAGISAIPVVVVLLVAAPLGALFTYLGITAKTTGIVSMGTIGVLVVAAVLIATPIFVLATVYSQAGLSLAAIRAHMGQKLTIRATLKEVQPRFWQYTWLLILQGIMVGLIPVLLAGAVIGVLALLLRIGGNSAAATVAFGFFAFIIFAACFVVVILRALSYAMSMAICVAEQKPAWDSLQRSLALGKGSRGRIFVMFLLVWALSTVISMIGYIPSVLLAAIVTAMGHGAQYGTIALAGAQIINFLVSFVLQTLITPVYITALVLFYFDQRVRTEGYDIEWMMEQAGLSTPGSPAPPDDVSLPSASTMLPDSVKEQ